MRVPVRLARLLLFPASAVGLVLATGRAADPAATPAERPTAAAPISEPLWPRGAPGALGTEPKDVPQLIWSLPPAGTETGAAIVVCPGGGYGHLAMDHEGKQVAAWLNERGIAAFVCDYRHRNKGYGHPAPLQDVQRAIRTVRARAEELGLDPARVGVLGFSAGGHLASTVSTHFDAGDDAASDPVERVSCRPDFSILCYPVIAMGEPYMHAGSMKNLLGESPDPKLVESLCNNKQVTKETPPTFLWHTSEDTAVKPENSIVYYQACLAAGVPVELHIFQKGRHGVGMNPDVPGADRWGEALHTWLTVNGIVPTAK